MSCAWAKSNIAQAAMDTLFWLRATGSSWRPHVVDRLSLAEPVAVWAVLNLRFAAFLSADWLQTNFRTPR